MATLYLSPRIFFFAKAAEPKPRQKRKPLSLLFSFLASLVQLFFMRLIRTSGVIDIFIRRVLSTQSLLHDEILSSSKCFFQLTRPRKPISVHAHVRLLNIKCRNAAVIINKPFEIISTSGQRSQRERKRTLRIEKRNIRSLQ